jgi:hypothetical protein
MLQLGFRVFVVAFRVYGLGEIKLQITLQMTLQLKFKLELKIK